MKVASPSIRMMIRVAGYALSAILAWIFYIGCLAIEISFSQQGGLRDILFGALIFCLFGGFSAALVLITVPWIFIVWTYRGIRFSGATYFACAGALLMVLVGCAVSSLTPKPLFIEDQTFFEGVFIALKRQGVCLALAGATLGFGYWFLAEKKCSSAERLLDRRDTLEARS